MISQMDTQVVMWCRSVLQSLRLMSTSRKVGVLFDVDGVLLRGGSVIPAAHRAFRKLVDKNNNFLLPVVFVTNAGSCQRHHKATQLSQLLEVQISPEQVVLSYSPLQMFKSFHEKCVLVSGQGPLTDIAKRGPTPKGDQSVQTQRGDLHHDNSLQKTKDTLSSDQDHLIVSSAEGFQKVLTMEQLREGFPLLDMVDHNRTARPQASPQSLCKIEAIILFGEPIRWETNLQLLIDVLLTDGNPASVYDHQLPVQLPVLSCNMDLVWMAEAPSPRFGHGMFVLCLESVYKKLTGRELQYEALLGKPSLLTYQYAERQLRLQNSNHRLSTIYAVGDNLMTDIYGANLYSRYLAQQQALTTPNKVVAQAMGNPVKTGDDLLSSAAECRSILVCTGVYNPCSPMQHDQSSPITEATFCAHRDQVLDSELVEPHHVVEDVEAAVDLLLRDSVTFDP